MPRNYVRKKQYIHKPSLGPSHSMQLNEQLFFSKMMRKNLTNKTWNKIREQIVKYPIKNHKWCRAHNQAKKNIKILDSRFGSVEKALQKCSNTPEPSEVLKNDPIMECCIKEKNDSNNDLKDITILNIHSIYLRIPLGTDPGEQDPITSELNNILIPSIPAETLNLGYSHQ
ncbi:hypothetical protein K6025_01905 [Ehrlichia sp. JZT12]